jgi:hypothetical protein
MCDPIAWDFLLFHLGRTKEQPMAKVKWNVFIMLISYGGLGIINHKAHMKVFLTKLLVRGLSFRGNLANSYCNIGKNKCKLQVEIGPQCT